MNKLRSLKPSALARQLVSVCILLNLTSAFSVYDPNKDWFMPYFTRSEVDEAGANLRFDVKCRHHRQKYCATAFKLGHDMEDDQFGSLNVPSVQHESQHHWFQRHGIKILKHQENSTNLYSFTAEFAFAGNSTEPSLAIFDNHFPYIAVHPNQMKMYESLLNKALLKNVEIDNMDSELNMSATSPQNPFTLESIDYFDQFSSQFYELEVLRKVGPCQGLAELLEDQDKALEIRLENHSSFWVEPSELFVQEEGTCTFGVVGFEDDGFGDMGMSVIGKPFLKGYEVAYQVVPEGLVLVKEREQQVDEKQRLDENSESNEGEIKIIEEVKQDTHKQKHILHYADFAKRFMKEHHLPLSWYFEDAIEFHNTSVAYAITGAFLFFFIALFGFTMTSCILYLIYEIAEDLRSNMHNQN